MTSAAGRTTVIGVGNPFRRDDGIGPAAAAHLRRCHLPGVDVTVVDGEPTGLLEAWAGAGLAVVVDAVVGSPAAPGRIHRLTPPVLPSVRGAVATHGTGVGEAVRLAAALDRLPPTLVVLGMEAADLGVGPGLSPAVTAALPALLRAVLAELGPPRVRTRAP